MPVYFPPPEPPAVEIVEEQCTAVYEEVVTMAPERVIDAHEDNAGSDSAEAAADDPYSLGAGRRQAIHDAATSAGAQAGLHWRYEQINDLLEEDEIASILDQTFRFSRMLSGDNVLYPVISEARKSFTISGDGQTARSSRVSWHIIEPARLASTPPTWRSYLHQSTSARYNAPIGLMPYDQDESDEWRKLICEGFRQGVAQANQIFMDRMTRLVRDYEGMMRYRWLAEQGVVSEPEVVEGRMGVRIAADGEKVHVDDRMIRITDSAAFEQSDAWKAISSLPAPGDPSATEGRDGS